MDLRGSGVSSGSSRLLLTREQLLNYNVETESWKTALTRRYRTHHDLRGVLANLEEPEDAIYDFFDMRLTPYIVQMMDFSDSSCPIRRQYLPSNQELKRLPYEMEDFLSEDHDTAESTRLVHRYPNRVLFLLTTNCASYCRYCTRKRFVSHGEQMVRPAQIEAAIEYLRSHPEIEDCLFSGGDPLFMDDEKLDWVIAQVRRRAPHVRFLRIGSRLPVQLPTRITPELCGVLERHNVQMLNIHVNHPREITPLLVERLKMLRKAGVMLGNQSVLLKGVNDDEATLRELCMKLVEAGVRPYYIYSNDPQPGNDQFLVSLHRMVELARCLRGWISGPAVPTFVVDGVRGLGKMPVGPSYFQRDAEGILFTNYEGRSARHDYLSRGLDLAQPVPL